MDIKAIETRYKGYRFRSRLEARWAVFFDKISVPWEYEKEGYEFNGYKYLPDFYLPTFALFVEVKGQDLRDIPGEDEKLSAFAKHIGKPLLIACGMPAAKGNFYYYSTKGGNYQECYCNEHGHSSEGPHQYELALFDPEVSISNALKMAFLEKHGADFEDWIYQVEYTCELMEQDGFGGPGGYEAASSARFEHGEKGHRITR